MSDWIKMRSALLQAPKLIAMGRALHGHRPFRDWLTPGGGGPINGQLVSDDALRCVTSALLLRVWSSSREHGKFVGDDLLLPCITVADLDVMAGVEGFGEAMRKVGWAIETPDGNGVILPNFKEYNVPKTPAERQQAVRDRKAEAKGRDAALRSPRNAKTENVAPRREEKREEKKHTPTEPTARSEEWAEFEAGVVRYGVRKLENIGRMQCSPELAMRALRYAEQMVSPSGVKAYPAPFLVNRLKELREGHDPTSKEFWGHPCEEYQKAMKAEREKALAKAREPTVEDPSEVQRRFEADPRRRQRAAAPNPRFRLVGGDETKEAT